MNIWKSRIVGLILLVLFFVFIRYSLYSVVAETYDASAALDTFSRIFAMIVIGLIIAPFDPDKNQALFFVKLAAVIIISLGFSGIVFDWFTPIRKFIESGKQLRLLS